MAAGDLIVKDHQYEYCGLLMGSSTKFKTESWDGLFDALPNLKNNDLTPNDRHGSIPGLDLAGGRAISGNVWLMADDGTSTQIYDLVEQFQAVFRPKQVEFPFVYQLPGRTKRYLMMRPRKSTIPKDADLTLGLGKAAVQLFASDPVHYEIASNNVGTNLNLPANSTSKTWSFTVGGNWWAQPVFTIQGPGTNYSITIASQTAIDGISDQGKTFSTNVVLGLTDVMVIDFNTKLITINGVPAWSIKNSTGDWWNLAPGVNQITINRASGSTSTALSTVAMAWQNAWMY